MKLFRIFLFTCFAVAVTLVCSGFQETEEHTIDHVYHTADGSINDIAKAYYKLSDKEVVGSLEDYQMLVRVTNRNIYNLQKRHLVPGEFVKIPVRKLKK